MPVFEKIDYPVGQSYSRGGVRCVHARARRNSPKPLGLRYPILLKRRRGIFDGYGTREKEEIDLNSRDQSILDMWIDMIPSSGMLTAISDRRGKTSF